MSNVTMIETRITPKMAAEILLSNTHNRKISQKIVERYARDMKSGNWKLTGEAISISKDGTVLDGQHRLLACVLANVSFLAFIVRGLSMDSQIAIDGGKKRSVGDQLHLFYGIENAVQKVAIANCIASTVKNQVTVSISPAIANNIIDLYSDEIEFVLCNRGTNQQLTFTPAVTAIIMAAKVDMDKAIDFKERYFQGNDLRKGHPALTLRNFMTSRGQWSGSGHSYRFTIMSYAFTALMNHFNNKDLLKLTTSSKGLDYFINKQKTCVNMITDWLVL